MDQLNLNYVRKRRLYYVRRSLWYPATQEKQYNRRKTAQTALHLRSFLGTTRLVDVFAVNSACVPRFVLTIPTAEIRRVFNNVFKDARLL